MTNSVTEEEVMRQLEQSFEEGIRRSDRLLYLGMAIALLNVFVAGYVWWVMP